MVLDVVPYGGILVVAQGTRISIGKFDEPLKETAAAWRAKLSAIDLQVMRQLRSAETSRTYDSSMSRQACTIKGWS